MSEQDVFMQAISRPAGAARERFLNHACGQNQALRRGSRSCSRLMRKPADFSMRLRLMCDHRRYRLDSRAVFIVAKDWRRWLWRCLHGRADRAGPPVATKLDSNRDRFLLHGAEILDVLRGTNTPRVRKGARNRLWTMERLLGNLGPWEDQNDQLQAVGFIMC